LHGEVPQADVQGAPVTPNTHPPVFTGGVVVGVVTAAVVKVDDIVVVVGGAVGQPEARQQQNRRVDENVVKQFDVAPK
jgi:hypothetical protein